eukprot:1265871-Rhodomonas_salina.1
MGQRGGRDPSEGAEWGRLSLSRETVRSEMPETRPTGQTCSRAKGSGCRGGRGEDSRIAENRARGLWQWRRRGERGTRMGGGWEEDGRRMGGEGGGT